MDLPSAPVLFARVQALPAAAALLARLADAPAAHLVGGAVRDLLMGGTPSDLDLVVEGDPAALAHRLGGRIRMHDRFGTSTVELDGFSYDIARSRRESYARPGALPDIEPASLIEDLRRRDFSVNAIAVALNGADPGEVTAVPGAFDDLDRRQLRVLHDASFHDDPTRLLRLARYWSRLGFDVEPHTLALAYEAVEHDALNTVTGPRIGGEVRLLAREPDPIASWQRLHDLGADVAIHSGFGISDPSLGRRALALLPADGRADLLSLAIATRGIANVELIGFLNDLEFPATDRDVIVAAATRADALADAFRRAHSPSQIAAAATGAGPELAALAGALGPEAAARAWLSTVRHVRLEIDGGDLRAAGVPEGPAIGRALRATLADKLDGRLRGRQKELARALEAAGETG